MRIKQISIAKQIWIRNANFSYFYLPVSYMPFVEIKLPLINA